jgi:hypothetical protein
MGAPFPTPAAFLEVAPVSLYFGDVVTGITATLVLQLTNTGNIALVVQPPSYQQYPGNPYNDSSYFSGGEAVTILPGTSFNWSIQFSSSGNVYRTFSALLQILSNATNSPISISLFGNCVATVSTEGIQVVPGAFDFGDVQQNNTPYLAASAAPTLSQTTSGGLSPATLYVKITYVNAFGQETGPSPESSLAVLQNNVLVVASPAAQGSGPGAATDYNVYVGTSAGTETLQNTTSTTNPVPVPVAIGTNWTEPTSGLLAIGASVPSSNNTIITNTTPTVTFTINSTGEATLDITAIDGSITPPYYLETGLNLPLAIAAGGSVTFTIAFCPSTQTGEQPITVEIVSGSPNTPTALPVTGNAVVLIPAFIIPGTQYAIMFGAVLTANSSIAALVIDPTNLDCEDAAYANLVHHDWGFPGKNKELTQLFILYEDLGEAEVSFVIDTTKGGMRTIPAISIGSAAADGKIKRAKVPVTPKVMDELLQIQIIRAAGSGPVSIVAIQPIFRVGGDAFEDTV